MERAGTQAQGPDPCLTPSLIPWGTMPTPTSTSTQTFCQYHPLVSFHAHNARRWDGLTLDVDPGRRSPKPWEQTRSRPLGQEFCGPKYPDLGLEGKAMDVRWACVLVLAGFFPMGQKVAQGGPEQDVLSKALLLQLSSHLHPHFTPWA